MYKLIKNTLTQQTETILKIDSNLFIPFEPTNIDYQEYLAWLAQGNEPEPADEAPE
jgi:hypothetical protein